MKSQLLLQVLGLPVAADEVCGCVVATTGGSSCDPGSVPRQSPGNAPRNQAATDWQWGHTPVARRAGRGVEFLVSEDQATSVTTRTGPSPPGQTQHAFRHNVALNLGGAA